MASNRKPQKMDSNMNDVVTPKRFEIARTPQKPFEIPFTPK